MREENDGLFLVYDGDYHDGRKPTGELFIDKVPQTKPDRLTVARKRYAAAVEALDEVVRIDEECDGFGIIPDEIKNEVAAARYELSLAEYERIKP